MPVFSIYSIGDAEFLEQILIAVAMITGTGDFKQLAGVGLLLGVLMICIQSLIQGAKEINFHQVLIGWIMYSCFFGPTCTITIEDGYTGQVRVVSNVPIGVGFTGSTISSIGYHVTKLFEQGYSTPSSVTQKPFAEPLKILNETRRRAYDSGVFQALNASNGGGSVDFRKSWDNYIRECTLTKLDMGIITLDEMFKAPYTEAFRFYSNLYGTKLYLSPSQPNGQDYTCTDAWGPLIAATNNVSSAQVQQILAPIIGIRTTAETPIGKITDSLTALGASSTTASNFIQMSLLEPLYFDAVMGKYQDVQDFTSAAMVNQAIMQRNTQWATEHTLFMTVVRPMMTFFEGFVYAITPIMGFLIVLGSAGIMMVGKYFQTILWIQLWMPVLSIINLYIITAANGDISRYAIGGLNSLYALSGAGDRLDTWIGTGGMLAAATPVISLFIVTGSTYAFTTLASRVGGADHINEKMASPDVMQNGPVAQMMPTFNGNSHSGLMRSGTESLMPTASFGGNISSGVQSAQARMQQAQQGFSETLGRSVTQGVSESDQTTRLSSLGQSVGSMNTKQSQAVSSKAQDFSRQFGVSDTKSNAVRGIFGLQATGSISTPTAAKMLTKFIAGIDGSASATGTATKESGAMNANKHDEIDKFVTGAQFSKSDSQALTNQLAHETKNSSTKSLAKTWGDTASRQVGSTANELISSADSYQTMSGLQKSMGGMSNIDMKTLGGSVAKSPEAMGMLNTAMQYSTPAARQEAADLESRYSNQGGMSPPVAQAAARMTALTNVNNFEPEEASRNFLSAAQVASTATGRNLNANADEFGPTGNSNINPVQPSNLGEKVGQVVQNTPVFNDQKKDQVEKGSVKGVGGPGNVYQHDAKGNSKVQTASEGNFEKVNNASMDNVKRELIADSKTGENFAAARIFGLKNSVGNVVGARAGDILDKLTGKSGSNNAAEDAVSAMPRITADQIKSDSSGARAQHESLNPVAKQASEAGLKALGKVGMEKLANSIGEENIPPHIKSMSDTDKGLYVQQAMLNSNEGHSNFVGRASTLESDAYTRARKDYGLTPAQSNLFASPLSFDDNKIQGAANRVVEEYAKKGSDGKPLRDSSGDLVMTEQNRNLANAVVSRVVFAANSGDNAGSMLNHVKHLNELENNAYKPVEKFPDFNPENSLNR